MTKIFTLALFFMLYVNNLQSQIDFTFSKQQCLGDTIEFFVEGAVDAVFWDFGVTAIDTDTSSIVNASWQFSSAGNYKVTLKYWTNGLSIINTLTDSVEIFPLPTVSLIANAPACNGTIVTLSNTGSTGSYKWEDYSTNATRNVIIDGEYILTVTDSNNCKNSDAISIVFDGPVINLQDIEICMGETGILDAGAGFVSYFWSNNAETQTTQVSDGGTYSVTVSDADGCFATDDVLVTEMPGPDLYDYSQIPASSVSLGSATLFANGGNGAIEYSVSGIYPFQSSNQFSGLAEGVYTAIAKDELGCTDELQIQILSDTEPVEPSDGFSPNGDGVNDLWRINKIEIYPEAVIRVFNRWNKLVFESKGNYQEWDGTLSTGGFVPSGTYFYHIDLKNGNESQVGYMTIIR